MAEGKEAKTDVLPSDADRLLTVEQAAVALRLSVSTIHLYLRQGTLSAYRIAGLRKVLIRESDLLALLYPVPVIPRPNLSPLQTEQVPIARQRQIGHSSARRALSAITSR